MAGRKFVETSEDVRRLGAVPELTDASRRDEARQLVLDLQERIRYSTGIQKELRLRIIDCMCLLESELNSGGRKERLLPHMREARDLLRRAGNAPENSAFLSVVDPGWSADDLRINGELQAGNLRSLADDIEASGIGSAVSMLGYARQLAQRLEAEISRPALSRTSSETLIDEAAQYAQTLEAALAERPRASR